MKHIFLLGALFSSLILQAQVNGGQVPAAIFFDPATDPVAIRSDTTFLLLVSEYILAKSVKASMGQDCQVLKTYKTKLPNGSLTLLFEGVFLDKNQQRFTISVPLLPDAQARFYYASSQALVCSSPGCNNCSIYNGNCVGCCAEAVGSTLSLSKLLSKIQTNIQE